MVILRQRHGDLHPVGRARLRGLILRLNRHSIKLPSSWLVTSTNNTYEEIARWIIPEHAKRRYTYDEDLKEVVLEGWAPNMVQDIIQGRRRQRSYYNRIMKGREYYRQYVFFYSLYKLVSLMWWPETRRSYWHAQKFAIQGIVWQ